MDFALIANIRYGMINIATDNRITTAPDGFRGMKKNNMKKENLIQIAKAGLPERIKQFINFENLEMHHWAEVYRLYDKDDDFIFFLPKNPILTVFMGEENFIQITCKNRAFNHYAAIKEMERLGMINKTESNLKIIGDFVEYLKQHEINVPENVFVGFFEQ